jgi:hypothetical protein
METSLSTILEPTDIFIQLILYTKLIYFCAVFAYDGFKNGITLTHVGMRKGTIAKAYGVFYSFFVLYSIVLVFGYVKELLATDGDKLKQALVFTDSTLILGFIFIGLSLFMFLLKEGLVRFSKKKIRINEFAQKMYNSMLFFLLAIGIQSLLGLPNWVYVGIFVFFTYFGAFASPEIIKKAMIVPSEKKSRKKKAASTEQGTL